MSHSPLAPAWEFWKPLIAADELDGLARYVETSEPLSHGVHVLRTDALPDRYHIHTGDSVFVLYAAVHPVRECPESAEIVARITDASGATCSHVLWYPDAECAVVPFDPCEAVSALRYERYMPQDRRTVLPPSVLSAYYALKPLLPRAVKHQLRQRMTRKAQSAEHFLSWPADRSHDFTMQLMLRLAMMVLGKEELPFVWFWPDSHRWAAILTHDVEGPSGLANVTHVMELEQTKGLHSSFNFVPHDYAVPDDILSHMRESGFEIGVHGYTHDGLMFAKRSTFEHRAKLVNEWGRVWSASGFRSPATYRNLGWFDDLDFEYDSSVTDTAPYEPQPGGCASQFPYRVGRLTELPMTVAQDHTLFNVLGHTDSAVWLDKLAQIRDAHAMACVLTHPDSGLGYLGEPQTESRYGEVLDFIVDSGAWNPLPRELARWWVARSSVALASQPEATPAGACTGTALLDSSGGLRLVAP